MLKNKLILLCLLNGLFVNALFAQKDEIVGLSNFYNFDVGSPNDLSFDVAELAGQGTNYALIVGVDKYDDEGIRDLDRPSVDAGQIKSVLNDYYTFEEENVIYLVNPTRGEIVNSLENLSKKVSSSDNLLIFYAGHGYWDSDLEIGYWLLADAQKKDKSTWFPNSTLRDYIKGIKSRHTLLIADACFSGGIFRTRSIDMEEAPEAVKHLYRLPSRKAMTSGALKEVPDQSVFMTYLLKRLKTNRDDYLPAERLFYSFKEAVISNSYNNQVPQYGEISGSGNEGGDFIFVRKK